MTGRDLRTVAERFADRYDDEERQELGVRATKLAEKTSTVHMMFNNDRREDAPAAAQRMRELLGHEDSP